MDYFEKFFEEHICTDIKADRGKSQMLEIGVYVLLNDRRVDLAICLFDENVIQPTHASSSLKLDDDTVDNNVKSLLEAMIRFTKRSSNWATNRISFIVEIFNKLEVLVKEQWQCTEKPLFEVIKTDVDNKVSVYVKTNKTIFKVDNELNLSTVDESEIDLVYRKGKIELHRFNNTPIICLDGVGYVVSLGKHTGGIVNSEDDYITVTTLTRAGSCQPSQLQILHLINGTGDKYLDVLVDWGTGNYYYFFDTDIVSRCVHSVSDRLVRECKSVSSSVEKYIKFRLPRVTYYIDEPEPKVDEVDIQQVTVYDNEKAYLFDIKLEGLDEIGYLDNRETLKYVTRLRQQHINRIYNMGY